MKKVSILIMAFMMTTGTSYAYTEHFEDGFINPTTTVAQESARVRLQRAIQQRRDYYFRNKSRTVDTMNRNSQRRIHERNKARRNTGGVSTRMNRKGELNFVPYYPYQREYSNVSYVRPNAKQTFRRRAVNYYREGGYAGKNELKEGVLYGSRYRVNIIPAQWYKRNRNLEDVTTEIRNVQRDIGKSEQVPSGYQKTTFRRGASSRYFMSPFQR